MADQFSGTVLHQWRHVGAALVGVTEGELRVGDTIHIKGHTTDFTQTLDSMQVDHAPVESAQAGDEVAIAVADREPDGERFVSAEEAAAPAVAWTTPWWTEDAGGP